MRPADSLASIGAGTVRGTERDGTTAFLGLPYGAPPCGADRWRAPRPVAPWTGVRDATQLGPAPPQPDRPVAGCFFGELGRQDEDCLALNVWSPGCDGRRPVVMWVHGGGLTIGAAGAEIFGGARLSRALDAVVITVGYRLGSLGWLHHPALADGPGAPSGNWGLQDLVAALRWVHEEAAAFGGDPQRVIAAGESAGAAAVLHLLGAPGAEGRLHGAIAMSPPLGESTHPAALGTAWAEALAAALGAGDVPGLRPVPAPAVVAAHERLLGRPPFAGTRGGAQAVIEPATLPADPLDTPSASLAVRVLIGTNADEATFFFRQPGRVLDPDPETLARLVARQPGVTDAEAVLRRARATAGTDDANELLVRIATEAIFDGPVDRWAQARAAAGGHVHRYRLAHRSPQPGLGAVHSIGVPLLFGSHGTRTGAWLTGDGTAARDAAAALQLSFAAWVHGRDPGWPLLPAGGTHVFP